MACVRKFRVLLAGLLVIAAVGFAGCGGSGDDEALPDGAAVIATQIASGSDLPVSSGGGRQPSSGSTGGEQQAPPSGGDEQAVDVCAIVSRDEATETLGLDVIDGIGSVSNLTDAECQWDAANGFGEILVEVRNGDPQRFTEYYESSGGEPVDGLGDRAKWDSIIGLEVLTAEYYVSVFTVNFGLEDAELRERSIELVRTILERLP